MFPEPGWSKARDAPEGFSTVHGKPISEDFPIQGRSKGGACGAAARNGVATGAQIWPKYHRLHPPPPLKKGAC